MLGELRKRLLYLNKPVSLMVVCLLAYGESCRKELHKNSLVDLAGVVP